MNVKVIKTIIVSFIFITIALLIYFVLFSTFNIKKQTIKNIDSITDSQIIEILKTNSDIANYITKNPIFKIEEKEILTKDIILAGQNGQNFQPVYIDLQLENNKYMKVKLINQSGNEGYIAIINFSNNTVQKAFGLLLFKAWANVGEAVEEIKTP